MISLTNPYGTFKLMVEDILRDLYKSDSDWKVAQLPYLNLVEKRNLLSVFGNDDNTHDGTGVCDYIHVVDLARAHV
jgi:UDP-glucose 4-epimerase